MRSKSARIVGALLVVALVGAACGKSEDAKTSGGSGALSAAATLRVDLDALLKEHVALAAIAVSNALAGNAKGFEAAAGALDGNSVDLAKAIGSIYGKEAQDAFLPLWRSHIGFFVDYTNGVAAGDEKRQNKAVTDLTQYTKDFGAFLAGANPNLTKDAVADLVLDHVLGLKGVVDSVAAGKYSVAYPALREATGHMGMIASALAEAITKQFPDKFA